LEPFTYYYIQTLFSASPSDLGIAFGSPIEVPDSQINASSSYGANFDSKYGRLNNPLANAAWCAYYREPNQWLMFDLGHTMLVTSVITISKGNGYQQWVISYKVQPILF